MMSPDLIGLCGRVDVTGVVLRLESRGFVRLAFADPLEPIAHIVSDDSRQSLDALEEGIARHLGDEVLIHAMEQRIRESYPTQAIVIPDVRVPIEARWIKRNGGQVWCVHRPGEEVLAEIPVDCHIWDDGTPGEIERQVMAALEKGEA